MARNSTDYYRENKKTRKVVYRCPSCSYETTGCKIQLMNHIHARHTPENLRPYQCSSCNRGFAQKAHLHNHLLKQHNIDIASQLHKIATMAYFIQLSQIEPKSKKTKARYNYYGTHSCIKSRDIKNRKHEYLPHIYLKLHDIHYDVKKGFITLAKVPLYKGVAVPRPKV